jgi:hypothetical protein
VRNENEMLASVESESDESNSPLQQITNTGSAEGINYKNLYEEAMIKLASVTLEKNANLGTLRKPGIGQTSAAKENDYGIVLSDFQLNLLNRIPKTAKEDSRFVAISLTFLFDTETLAFSTLTGMTKNNEMCMELCGQKIAFIRSKSEDGLMV